MRFKTAVSIARQKQHRYIQRMRGDTLFDAIKYNASNLDEEDIYADDWILPDQDQISYRDSYVRFGATK